MAHLKSGGKNMGKEEIKYVSKIQIGNTIYHIRADIVEVFPTTCQKCGGSFELHHGEGQCPYCGTHYTTMYKVVEN